MKSMTSHPLDALDKIVPQDACWIFQDPHINRDVRRLIFNGWSTMSLLHVEQLPQFAESGKTPITLFGNKTVVRIYQGR